VHESRSARRTRAGRHPTAQGVDHLRPRADRRGVGASPQPAVEGVGPAIHPRAAGRRL